MKPANANKALTQRGCLLTCNHPEAPHRLASMCGAENAPVHKALCIYQSIPLCRALGCLLVKYLLDSAIEKIKTVNKVEERVASNDASLSEQERMQLRAELRREGGQLRWLLGDAASVIGTINFITEEVRKWHVLHLPDSSADRVVVGESKRAAAIT